MGWFSRLLIEAAREGPPAPSGRGKSRIKVELEDFGLCLVKVEAGDLDGSGEMMGVQLAYRHDFDNGAFAMSAREAELVSRALHDVAEQVTPHERFKARASRWQREYIDETLPVQTGGGKQKKRPEHLELSPAEAEALLRAAKKANDPLLEDVINQLEVPF